MTLRQLSAIQWVGLMLGGLAWAAQQVAGYGLTLAECRAAGARWSIPNDTWQTVFLGISLSCILVAGAASVTVLVRTRDVSYEHGEPPLARIRFFAIAAAAANSFFLVIALLSWLGAVFSVACRHA